VGAAPDTAGESGGGSVDDEASADGSDDDDEEEETDDEEDAVGAESDEPNEPSNRDVDPIFNDFDDLSLEELRVRIDVRPHLVRETDGDGWLLLHHAVRGGSKLDTVQYLVGKWPGSVQQPCRVGGQLPLHLVGDETDADVARFLLEAWPPAIRVRDRYDPDDEDVRGRVSPAQCRSK
jgi:hypothetical protein